MEMAWYCKANFKINSPRLETKKDKSCLHSFKYTAKRNIKQIVIYAHSGNINKEWYSKKYQKLHKEKSKLIHSVVSRVSLLF